MNNAQLVNTLNIVTPILLIVVAIVIINLNNILSAILGLGLLGLLAALQFYIMQAPDVAITEAAVGAALTTAIYLLALKNVGKGANDVGEKH